MTQRPEHLPGQSAPTSALYEQIRSRRRAYRIKVLRGEPLPSAPMGHSWAVVEGDAGECRRDDGNVSNRGS